jgi:sulfoxide reductase heme-binding subunit YedZ
MSRAVAVLIQPKVLIPLSLVVPFVAWWISVGDPTVYWRYQLPPGQALFALAKLAGLASITLMTFQAVWALVSRSPWRDRFVGQTSLDHQALGLAAGTLALAHGGLFIAASTLRRKVPAWDLLLPNFDHGYYFACVSLGAIALHLLMFVTVAGWQLRKGNKRWKPLHWTWLAVFALSVAHSLGVGGETRDLVVATGYLFGTLCVVVLLAARFQTRKVLSPQR